MKRRILTIALLVAGIAGLTVYADKANRQHLKEQRIREIALALPDSIFEDVKMEDLLDDEVYLKLAHDGWSAREISQIMNTALSDKAKAKLKGGYGFYAKQWRPTYGRALGDDTLYTFVDTTLTKKMIASIEATVPSYDLNSSWDKIPYTPEDRLAKKRNPGYFRPVELNPSSGRIHHIVLHPDDPDKLYVVADGTGIFATDNCGKDWRCITDRIPDRMYRSQSQGFGIPVDPYKWEHLFAFMDNYTVYETVNGGQSWRKIQNATHKNFKRGYCFRDKAGKLKFIGSTMVGERMYNELYISEDTCKTWVKVNLDASLKETNNAGVTGLWFQQMYFPQSDPDKIILPGSKSILYFDDGAQKNESGNYTLKRMVFNVLDQDGNPIPGQQNVSLFPFPGDCPGHMEIDPNDNNKMWYALARRDVNRTALFYSEDGGKNWITRHNELPTYQSDPIGTGRLYGNEAAHSWLGGFGVNFKNPNLLYGCSMSSAKSNDGGRTWTEFPWTNRIKSKVRIGDGDLSNDYYYVSASRHNADNHTIASHKSGRVFRGSDGGMFMIDPDVNGGEWTNIGNNMGQMLFYNIRTNEFGDFAIMGNTQDIDVQTYRYGRWGNWRGYEGSEASFNPFSNTEYFSGGNGGGIDGMNFDSWHRASNYADVRTGSWYMLRTWNGNSNPSTLYRIDDIGGSVIDLYSGINNRIVGIAMARDNDKTTIYATTADGYFYVSTDNGDHFEPLKINGQNAKFSNTKLTVDPNNSRYIYLGQNGGKVYKWDTQSGTFPALGTGLPSINCDKLLFHEGSGDLYFISNSGGIYILEKGSSTWKFWMRGYNGYKINDCVINYTSQEMVISDYGRGVFVADLQNPADRFFNEDNPLRLKEYSNVNGRRTIGIDSDWKIPMYYNYKWTVNGTEVGGNHQYLVYPLNNNDKVQLTLTLRESPDVETDSELFVVKTSEEQKIVPANGKAMYSDGKGRMDIGWMDWFDKDFTVDLWVRPESDGVIIANRQREANPDLKGAKGWMLYIEGGKLKFLYSPTNYFSQPTYEQSEPQTITMEWGTIPMGEWSHVAVTQKRDGQINIYRNGVAGTPAQRQKPDHSLNNSVCLSLFGDINERNCLKGTIDELKIWNRVLSPEELRKERYSNNLANKDGLVGYYSFNADSLATDKETFTGYQPLPRTKATPTYLSPGLAVSANYAASGTIGSGKTEFNDGKVKLLDIESSDASLSNATAYVYGYDAARWDDDTDNLDGQYFEPASIGYLFSAYNTNPNTTGNITFHNGSAADFQSSRIYRLYYADNGSEKTYWKPYGENLQYDGGALKLENVLLSDLNNKKLMVVALKPALELSIDGLNADGNIEVFEEDQDKFRLTLSPIAGQKTPTGVYSITSDNGIIDTPDLTFRDGVASDYLRVAMEYLGDFNQHIPATLSGQTKEMMPVSLDVVNRITPHELGNSVSIEKGGMVVDNVSQFNPIFGTQNMTIMGWLRMDSEDVITRGCDGTGRAPLLFFRLNGSANCGGLHFQRGDAATESVLSCHWNDANQGKATNLKVSTKDVGKWVHIAMTTKPDSIIYYLNGMKYGVKKTVPGSNIKSALMFGQNIEGNTWFSGSFDHVAVWNRTLSDAEVRRYMQERVLLNDPGLLSYITMDHFDENGKIYDLVSGSRLKEYGTVTKNQSSTVPFQPDSRERLEKNNLVKFGNNRAGTLTTFNGQPYNSLSAENTAIYYPLNREYYTAIFDAQVLNSPATTLTYTHPSIVAGDKIALGIRQLGDPEPMETFIEGTTDTDGTITFDIPAGTLDRSVEMTFLLHLTDDGSRRPLIVNHSETGVKDGDRIMLSSSSSNRVNVVFEVESSNAEDELTLSVGEINYASVSGEPISLSKSDRVTVPVTINVENLDKFALNPVTVTANTNVVGATVEPLTFYVYYRPRVALSLKNGDNGSPTDFTATTPYPKLDIDATLVEGYLDEDVRLKFTPDNLGHSLNLAGGSLLVGADAAIGNLDYEESAQGGAYDEGWNLIGNPFLADINLTKHQNMDYAEGKMTHFVYNPMPGCDNFIAYDMTDYDDQHKILPFSSFFVQTLQPEAAITVKEEAKEQALSRKTFDYYNVDEVKAVELTLVCDGKETDRTVIKWVDGASNAFVVNEDAPKMWARTPGVSEIYTLSGEPATTPEPPQSDMGGMEPEMRKRALAASSSASALSINVVDSENESVDLGFDIDPSVKSVQIVARRVSGFGSDYAVYLVNESKSETSELQQGETYDIDPAGQHTITLETKVETGVDKTQSERRDYRIYTSSGQLTVTGLGGNADIRIFNLSGIMMHQAKVAGSSHTVRIPDDVYIVRIIENGKEYVAKIVVK